MKMKISIATATLIAVFAGSVAQAGLFTDNFNRSNTSATDATAIGSTWVAGVGADTTADWAIWDNKLQFKGLDDWGPANFMYNTDAITTAADFTMKLDIVPNHPMTFGNAIGAVWQMGDHDGGGAVDDGYGIRMGDAGYQLVRMSDGGFDMQVGAGSFSSAMQQGVSYTLTVTATGNTEWNISLERTSDSLSLLAISASNTPTYGDWGAVDGGYGGVMYNSSAWESSTDNFSVESPDAIPEPATMALLGLAASALFGFRRFAKT